ncbi:Bug family tripartite tricarboxylate transporter substrate binding protein [Hydrogenophaga sp.]|uniref:Bug family tripartite tricarboxylate transporter substrate binding protein n=1 Tax=Hydrogenophaga sp. TaxID=1904254 RepID=UPI003F6E5B84
MRQIYTSTLGRLFCSAALVLLLLASPRAFADTWPTAPVRIVVNFPAGGAVDAATRLIAAPLSEAIHQPVIVENRGGANGNIGAEAVVKAKPDGMTLLASAGGVFAVNPALYPSMSFNPEKDLDPVAALMRVSLFLVGAKNLPVSNARDFIAYARANPGKLLFASAGSGSLPHLAAEMFNAAANVSTLHVSYRGAAPALTDLLGGQVDYMFDPGISLSQVRAGKLKLLAVADPARSMLFPDVPTLAEAGLEKFQADSWYGLYAPAGTAPELVARINREINRIVVTPSVRQGLQALGGSVMTLSPVELREKAQRDASRFGTLIREKSIRAE